MKDCSQTGGFALFGSPTAAAAAAGGVVASGTEEKGGSTRPMAVKSHGKGTSSSGGDLVPDGSAAVLARANSLPSGGARTTCTTVVLAELAAVTAEQPSAGHREHVQRCASSPLLETASLGDVGVGSVIPAPGKPLLLEESKTPASPENGTRFEEHEGTAEDGWSAAAAADGLATSITRTGTATMTASYSPPTGRQTDTHTGCGNDAATEGNKLNNRNSDSPAPLATMAAAATSASATAAATTAATTTPAATAAGRTAAATEAAAASTTTTRTTAGDKSIDAGHSSCSSEHWSDLFRDKRLMEDNFRRRALLRELFLSPAERGEGRGNEYPDEYGTGGAEPEKRNSGACGRLRKTSGKGASFLFCTDKSHAQPR